MNQGYPLISEARKLTERGFPIIPLNDKIPIIGYEHKRNQLATTSEIDLWFSNGNSHVPMANGIAIAINSTEFGIDTDGDKCESAFLNEIVSNLSTELQDKICKTMYTKTPHGYHRMFNVLPEDFPDGIKERTIAKSEGHSEIAVKGNDHILFERGPGYVTVNDVDCIVTLSKEETIQLLEALDRFKAETNAVKTIVGTLIPHYTNGRRDSLVFALSGYLHKNGVSESFIFEIVERLVSQANDEESQARLRVVKDTCSKDANSDQVSGYNRLLEALDNNQSAIADIEQVLNELGLETFNGISRKRDIQNGEVERILPANILHELTPHIYKLISYNPLTFIVADQSRKEIIKSVVKNLYKN
jgi:Bifunctional DNA primase/polymerase, N-terminal